MNKNLFTFAIVAIFVLIGCSPSSVNPTNAPVLQPNTPTTIPTFTSTIEPTKKPTAAPSETPLAMPTLRTPESREAFPAKGIIEFHILHWNDFHGELGEETIDGTWIPGAARLAAFIKSERAKYEPGEVLTLDAGDWFEGSKFARPSHGMKVLDFYQLLKVDAITVGNHEFFLGARQFYEIASRAAPIEILSVNLRNTGANNECTDDPIVNPYAIFELGKTDGPKVRIAVVGAGANQLERQSYTRAPAVCFIDPVEEIVKIYDQLKVTEHPDIIIALTHNGLEHDRELAKTLNDAGKPVDMIIGGHSHSWMDAPEKVGKTTIITAGELGRGVGVFDMTYDRARSKLAFKWHEEIFSACSPEDAETVAFLQDTVPASNPKKACDFFKNPDYDYLIDLKPISASVGYWSLGKGKFPASEAGMIADQVITSHGKEYPLGLFAHSPSQLRFALDGKYTTFVTTISLNESACGDGATFVVSLDNKEIYRSENILPSTKPIPLSLDVSGGKILKLQTISGSDMSCDWTIWGDPYLVKSK